MKRIFFFLFVLSFVCAQVHARAVKLGRNIDATSSYKPVVNVGTGSEIAKQCDANCQDCDGTTGQCLLCNVDRYLSGKLCLICPEKSYCDGETAIPNCTDVACRSGSFAEATDTGCCCITNCSGVSCKAGYSPAISANGCCCV